MKFTMNLADNAPGRRSSLPHAVSVSSTSSGVTQRVSTPSFTSSDSPIQECTTGTTTMPTTGHHGQGHLLRHTNNGIGVEVLNGRGQGAEHGRPSGRSG